MKRKKKGSTITCMVHTGSNFLIQRRSLCLRGEVTVLKVVSVFHRIRALLQRQICYRKDN